MNVYDFDGTIYQGDSTVDFFLYTLKRNPLLLQYLPKQVKGFCLYELKRISKTQMKEFFFSFLAGIDSENLVLSFWDEYYIKINDWYFQHQEPEDIIISASPEFLLKPVCLRMGINYLIASNVNPQTGHFVSENCYGQEKVRRLLSEYGAVHVNRFYSDSKSDFPLAKMAEEAFMVKNGKVENWWKYKG